MNWLTLLFVVGQFSYIHMHKHKKPKVYNETGVSAVLDNPNFIRDRLNNIFKPPMPPKFRERFDRPYTPAWMDYCAPYHCNDYHRAACGINRQHEVFKWFQSGCHIELHNMCSSYRGSLQYDRIDPKACYAYINTARAGCSCEPGGPIVCAVSLVDNRVALFKDGCALRRANCDVHSFDEYEQVDMGLCVYYLKEGEE